MAYMSGMICGFMKNLERPRDRKIEKSQGINCVVGIGICEVGEKRRDAFSALSGNLRRY